MTTEAATPPAELERLFLRTLRRSWGAVFSHSLRRNLPGHLTPQQAFVLGHLHKRPGQPSELAREQHVGMPAITGLVDGLVARRLVERRDDPRDRRVVRLFITAEGEALWSQVEAQLIEAAGNLLAPLRPEQRDRLAAALGDLAALTEEQADCSQPAGGPLGPSAACAPMES